MSMYLAVGGLIVGIALSAVNMFLIWKANEKESLAMPTLLPFVPLVLNVYSIRHMPVAPQMQLVGYISAVFLESAIDIVWPFVIREWFNGITPLHRAARSGNKALVEHLLDNGADIDARNITGWSAIEIAAWRGRNDVVDLLASREADLSAWKESVWGTRYDTLGMAASAGRFDVVRLLVEKHSAIDNGSQQGYVALEAAVTAGHGVIVRYLLSHGASVRPIGDEIGDTLVHIAVRRGDTDILGELILQGAEVNAKNGMGMTPLKMALTQPCRNRKAMAELLRQNGAHV